MCMKIYIDSDFKCHITNPDNSYRSFNVRFFDGKCQTLIEGYRYIPSGESWVRSDGRVFSGETMFPWKPWSELDEAQLNYEWERIEEYSKAFSEISAIIKPQSSSGTMETIVEARKQAIISRFDDIISSLTSE